MQSQSPWRQLKQVGNQCTPNFQWVLPSELQAQVQARVESGIPLPGRKKAAKKVPGPRQQAAAPVVLQPDQFELSKGVFVAGSPAQELQQLALSDVGSQAVGVVMTTKDLAAPYLSLQKAVSAGPLALLLLGEDTPAAASVASARVQFPATCKATGEPALLKALLVQIGTGEVQKHVPESAARIEIVESAVLRLSVYKDQWPQPWAALCVGPLKLIIEHCPPLQACDQVGCQCPCWHGLAGPRDPESILELWAATSLRCTFGHAQLLRLKCSLSSFGYPCPCGTHCSGTLALMAYSLSPGTALARKLIPSSAWSGFLRPLCRSLFCTAEHAVGIARTGTRFGIRCLQVREETLHNALRPSVPFLGPHAEMIFHAGPLPYGVQRHAVAKALKAFGWPAKPLHTIPGGSGDGLWWAFKPLTARPVRSCIRSRAKF